MLAIAHVLTSFEIGGGERVAVDIAAGQHAGGHRVIAISLASGPDGPHGESFRNAGVPGYQVAKLGPSVDPTLPLRLAWLFRRERIDVVHTHDPQPLIYAGPGGKLARAAVIHTIHGFNPAPPRRLWLCRAAARFADELVAVSADTAAEARARREYPAARVRVIANGIELSGFDADPAARVEVRAELGIPEDAPVIGTVGRVAPVKNQALLIRAAAPLLAQGAHLVVVGDGELLDELRAQAGAIDHADRAHLVGRRLDVARMLSAFDVFALSSVSEGLPLVIAEAMASSLPVVSTAVGGIPDVVIEGRTGYLVPSENEEALRARLLELVEDAGKRAAFGARAREVALAEYSAGRMLDDYMALYEAVLAR